MSVKAEHEKNFYSLGALMSTVIASFTITVVVFVTGDSVYGRIDVNPAQSLGKEFDLEVEKVFLCAGKDGYIPKYDPENGEYGCVENSPKLQQVFRLLVCKQIFFNSPVGLHRKSYCIGI